jgi:urease accessory protein
MEAHSLRLQAGVTSPHPNTMVARVMSPVTEPAMQLLKQIWAAWRQDMWQLSSTHPRLWNL